MRLCKCVILSLLFLSTNSFAEAQITGIWKHTQKPAWLEIRFESGIGSLAVKRHEDNLKAEGFNVIKEIKPDTNRSAQWDGQMYSAAENGYVDVTLVLINPTTIAVFESSDVKKSNEILRITRE